MAVLLQLSATWAGVAPFAGCHLAEAGIPARRMLHAVRGLVVRDVIGADEAAWLADQLASAGAEIEGDRDPELCRIRGRLAELKMLRAAEARRMVDLKVVVLRRCEEGPLAALLEQDPGAYALMTEAGERSVMRRRAA